MSRASMAWILVVITIALGYRADGQSIIDRVPQGAILYVGWRGAPALQQAYGQSKLSGVIGASELPRMIEQTLPQAIDRIGQDDRELADDLRWVRGVLAEAWDHPSALCVGPLDAGDAQHPWRVALMIEAGDDARAMAERLRRLATGRSGSLAEQFTVTRDGDHVIMQSPGTDMRRAAEVGAVANRQMMQNLLARTGIADPAAIIYFDAKSLTGSMRAMIEGQRRDSAGQAVQMPVWMELLNALALDGLEHAVWAGGFEGTDWTTAAYIQAPAPRSGLLAMLDAKPLEMDLLKAVPDSATNLWVVRFDASRLIEQVRTAVGKVDPTLQQQMDKALGAAQVMLGLNVQRDLLGGLGDQWVLYTAPSVGGGGLLGTVLINRLSDPAKAGRALSTLEIAFNNITAGQTRRAGVQVVFKQSQANGLGIHYAATPLISPAWAIQDDTLYVGLFPEIVSEAAAHTSGGGRSILDSPAFQSVRKKLPDQPIQGLAFADLPRSVIDAYPVNLLMSHLMTGSADLFGIDAPAMVLPPLPKLMAYLEPSGSVTWSDQTGWYYRSHSPFPGSMLFTSVRGAVIGNYATLASLLVPSLMRARTAANVISSASNLRQVGQGVLLYATDHQGMLPADLGTTARELGIDSSQDAKVYLSPEDRGRVTIPPNLSGQQLADWINQNSSYVYIQSAKPLGRIGNLGLVIMAYEKPESSSRSGMVNVLFVDGHVELMAWDQVQKQIESSRKAGIP